VIGLDLNLYFVVGTRTSQFKIKVTNLPAHATAANFQAAFEPHGAEDAELGTNGVGFVSFATKQLLDEVLTAEVVGLPAAARLCDSYCSFTSALGRLHRRHFQVKTAERRWFWTWPW
jgi:hypothetical protein